MTTWVLIVSLLFDVLAGAFIGAMAWFFFHQRLSSSGAAAIITGACALLIAAAWGAGPFSGGMLLLQLVCGFLVTPFSIVWFSGTIPSMLVALLLQVLLMGGVGWLVWHGLVALKNQDKARTRR